LDITASGISGIQSFHPGFFLAKLIILLWHPISIYSRATLTEPSSNNAPQNSTKNGHEFLCNNLKSLMSWCLFGLSNALIDFRASALPVGLWIALYTYPHAPFPITYWISRSSFWRFPTMNWPEEMLFIPRISISKSSFATFIPLLLITQDIVAIPALLLEFSSWSFILG